MTRHWLAFVAAVTAGAPALAQDRPPAPASPPAWGDPRVQAGPPAAGAPFAPPPPPGAYPMPGPLPVPAPGTPPYDYGYQDGRAGPCGCGGAAYVYVWVPVHIRTSYVYSAPIQHIREVPEESVVYREAVETRTVPVRGRAKYVKGPRPVKVTKGKAIRAAK